MRRSLLAVLGVITIVLVLLVATVLLLPAERIGAFAATQASAALQREVAVERFGIRLLPRPAVALENVVIGGISSDDSAFARAARVDLRPKLLPLLRRRIVIDEVAFQGAVIRIAIAADSTSNIPTFDKKESTEGGDAELDIRSFRITDGTVTYTDATTGTAARLSGITQSLELSGSLASGELTRLDAAGELAIRDIDIDAPASLAWPIRDLRLHIGHDVLIDRANDRIELTRLSLGIQEVTLGVTGAITAFTDSIARTVDLRAETGSIDVARLVASLPKALLDGETGETLSGAAGRAQLSATIAGRAGTGATPRIDGTLTFEDAALARGRYGTIVDQLAGTIAFSLDSVSTAGITGRLLGEPMRVAFTVHDPAAPKGSVAVRAALALAQAEKLGFMPDSTEAGGRIAIDIAAEGALDQPADARVTGTVDLASVELRTAPLMKPMTVREGRIELDGRNARARGLTAVIGASDVALDLDVAEWLPWTLGDTLHPPVVTFDARSTLFDADEILGAKKEGPTYGQLFFARLADRPIDGRSAAEVAESLGLGMPEVPDIPIDGRIHAARFVRGGVPFDDVDVTVAARDGTVEVRGASFRMFGGGVHMTGRMGLAAPGTPAGAAQPLVVDYSISDIAAAEFLQRFTGFRDHITGDMLITGSLNAMLDQHLLPVRESVAGGGTLAILAGQIVNWPMLRGLGDRIGVAQFDTLAFNDWSGRYKLVGTKIILEESMLESGEMAVRAAGAFDVNGALDLGATLLLPQEWTERVPGAPAGFLAGAAAGPDGRVPIGARFAGTSREPAITIDMSEAGARVANAAREAAAQQAREAAARAAERIGVELPVRDSLGAQADSAKKKIESEIGNRLRRIIKPGGS